jgi:hypothetical protein
MYLWSDDCRALIAAATHGARSAVSAWLRCLASVATFVELAHWTHDQIDEGLTSVTRHVKRQVWLAMFPREPQSAPVQSAQRPKGGKG